MRNARIVLVGILLAMTLPPVSRAQDSPPSLFPSSEPIEKPTTKPSLFRDPTDGYFDMSGFLSSHVGFLPVAVPITEPEVGYGLTIGASFFHGLPRVIPGENGAPPRVIMPSTTVLFGAGTENGTWAAGIGHLGIWNDGRIRYAGAIGYASANLEWFGKNDNLHGQSISYTNDILFVYQKITFQIGDSNFFIGPLYKFLDTDASFSANGIDSGIPGADLASKTSGLGIDVSYDSLDQPFSPTRGIRADITYSQQANWLGGDFNYGQLKAYGIVYFPLTDKFVLGLNFHGDFDIGDAPFYDLSSLNMRGLQNGKYVDNDAVQAEAELRYDITPRWTLVTFGGIGRVGATPHDLLDADTHAAVGAGFRYLIARKYGMRMGIDLAHADDSWVVYVTVGTGWVRP